jgi:hypothetical protein
MRANVEMCKLLIASKADVDASDDRRAAAARPLRALRKVYVIN